MEPESSLLPSQVPATCPYRNGRGGLWPTAFTICNDYGGCDPTEATIVVKIVGRDHTEATIL